MGCKHMITYISNRRRSGGVSHRVIDAPVPRVRRRRGDACRRGGATTPRRRGGGGRVAGGPPGGGVTDDAGLETRAGERTVRAARGWGPRGLAPSGFRPGAGRAPGRPAVAGADRSPYAPHI